MIAQFIADMSQYPVAEDFVEHPELAAFLSQVLAMISALPPFVAL